MGIGGPESCHHDYRLCNAEQARLDFDEDMPELSLAAAAEQVAQLRSQVAHALSTARQGHLLRSGLQVGSPAAMPLPLHFLIT